MVMISAEWKWRGTVSTLWFLKTKLFLIRKSKFFCATEKVQPWKPVWCNVDSSPPNPR